MLDWLMQQKGAGLLVFDILLCATGWKLWSTGGGSQAVAFYLSEQCQKSPESPQASVSSITQQRGRKSQCRQEKMYYIKREKGRRRNKLAYEREKEDSLKLLYSWWLMPAPNPDLFFFSHPPHIFHPTFDSKVWWMHYENTSDWPP